MAEIRTWYPQVWETQDWRWVGRSTPTAPAAADEHTPQLSCDGGRKQNILWAATLQTSGAFHASSRLILTMILQSRTSLLTWYSEKERTHLESKSRDRAIQLEAWCPPPPTTTNSIPKEPGGFPTHHQAPCSTHTRDGGLFSMEIKHKRFKILVSQE